MTIRVSVGSRIGYGGNAKIQLGGRYVHPSAVYPWADDFEDDTIGLTAASPPWEIGPNDTSMGLVAAQPDAFYKFGGYDQSNELDTGASVNPGIQQDTGEVVPSAGFKVEIGLRTEDSPPHQQFFASAFDAEVSGSQDGFLAGIYQDPGISKFELQATTRAGGVIKDSQQKAMGGAVSFGRPTKMRLAYTSSSRLFEYSANKGGLTPYSISDSLTVDVAVNFSGVRWFALAGGPFSTLWAHNFVVYFWVGSIGEPWPIRNILTAPY
jgi:hypothetical protein